MVQVKEYILILIHNVPKGIMNSLGCLLFLACAVLCVSADDGWVPAGGRYLKFFDTPKSFADAWATCEGIAGLGLGAGGHIAYDDHPAVNQHIAKSSNYVCESRFLLPYISC